MKEKFPEQTQPEKGEPEERAIEKGALPQMEQFAKWVREKGLLSKEDEGKPLEHVSLGKYYKEHLEDWEKDVVNKVLELPDNRSEALREQIIEADSILHEEIKRKKREKAPDEELKELEELRKSVRAKFERNEFKV